MTDSTLARDLIAYLDQEQTGLQVEADVRRIIAEHELATSDPMLDALYRLTAQVERIADQGAEADLHVTETEVHEAWESTGQRAQHHLAVALVEKLGIVVDA